MVFTNPRSLVTKFQIAHLRLEARQAESAKVDLTAILSSEEIGLFPTIHWSALYDRGRIAEHENQAEEAIKYYQASIDEIEKIRSTINTEGSRIGFFGDKQDVYRRLFNLLFKQGRYGDAFAVSEQSKSRALVDMLSNKNDFYVPPQSGETVRTLLAANQEREIALLSDGTSSELLKGFPVPTNVPEEKKVEVTRGIVSQIRGKADTINRQISGLDANLVPLVSVVRVTPEQIQKRLDPDQTILSYYYDKENLVAFVVDAKRIAGVTLKRDGLEEDIQKFRTLISTLDSNYQPSARALYDRLVLPVLPELKTTKLVIAGHGALHYLPFATLSDDKTFLGDQFNLSFLPSASTIQFMGRSFTTSKPGNILVLGNPDLGDRKYDLAFAEKEALIVSRTLPQSEVFLRKNANKTNLKANAAGFRFLHLAMHGVFDTKNPLDSALLLAPEKLDDPQSGRLTIGDLYTMRIDVDLVTLSACESGLGGIGNGDELIGLSRGFMYAGARSILSSLWQVDDQATAILMEVFYRSRGQGMASGEALREAQREVRSKGYIHPFFWAAFQLTGASSSPA
jgi:CHAT domain-containing protein